MCPRMCATAGGVLWSIMIIAAVTMNLSEEWAWSDEFMIQWIMTWSWTKQMGSTGQDRASRCKSQGDIHDNSKSQGHTCKPATHETNESRHLGGKRWYAQQTRSFWAQNVNELAFVAQLFQHPAKVTRTWRLPIECWQLASECPSIRTYPPS